MVETFATSTVSMAVPILLAALGELIVERAGLINIGIEGAMLAAAFFSLSATYLCGSVAVGLVSAVAAAIAINALFALAAINLAVNQVIAGTALNILSLGLTGVFYRRLFGATGSALMVKPIGLVPLGRLSRLPIIGAALFDQTPLGYFAFVLTAVLAFTLSRTVYGLKLTAVGENPAAADALGMPVYCIRWLALLFSGVLSGLAGAFLTLAYTGTFVEGVSAGRGFIALAVVIVGRWNPWGAAAASLFFGGAMALQFTLQAVGSGIPYQLFLAMPYVLTVVVLALSSYNTRTPSALGAPYVRG